MPANSKPHKASPPRQRTTDHDDAEPIDTFSAKDIFGDGFQRFDGVSAIQGGADPRDIAAARKRKRSIQWHKCTENQNQVKVVSDSPSRKRNAQIGGSFTRKLLNRQECKRRVDEYGNPVSILRVKKPPEAVASESQHDVKQTAMINREKSRNTIRGMELDEARLEFLVKEFEKCFSIICFAIFGGFSGVVVAERGP